LTIPKVCYTIGIMARIPRRDDAGPPRPTASERAAKRALLGEIDRAGWFLRGSLLQVANRCGKPSCRCKGDPPRPHGPYWQWTRKVNGKTVSVRLTDEQAGLVTGWIENAKSFDHRVAELEALSAEVAARVLAAVATE
jgi:hypothetical protein